MSDVLNQESSSDASGSIYIQPPAVHELTDEDSGDEESFTPANMTRNQLLAEC